ncbi:MAG: hypothetical protein RR505_05965 [Raoultibacter sp.]
MRELTYQDALIFTDLAFASNAAQSAGEAREATQSDIDALLR